jgi:hypothetical protein
MPRFSIALGAIVLSAVASAGPVRGQACDKEFDSTFDLIQEVVFENRGCTNDVCHGAAASGGLDLRAGLSHDSLIDQPAVSAPGWQRVVPGQKDESLLYVNLAAKTLPDAWSSPLRSMPLDPEPALSFDELEAVRLWVEYGAPREGVVPGTGELLDACLPPREPVAITPLPPPLPGTGVQLHMPRWFVPAQGEGEICFASYYDVSDQVPAEFRDPTGTKFRIKRSQIRQDPLSHHLISSPYEGTAAPDDPVWGDFRCVGGPREGESCTPTDLSSCGEGECATVPVSLVGCVGFGPPDSGFFFAAFGITGSQETAAEFNFAEGAFYEFPLKGIIVWNSHAFNLTDVSGKLEAWMNLDFAAAGEQLHEVQRIFDVSAIFKMSVPAFSTEEVCHFYRFPRNAEVFELSSHMHQRGKRFRVWHGEFACDGGPNAGDACSPAGYDRDSPDLCAGAACTSSRLVTVGDCDGDGEVAVHEVVTGVRIALRLTDVDECAELDFDANGSVVVSELVMAVDAALYGTRQEVPRDAESEQIYLSFFYDDPVTERFDPPVVFDDPDPSQRVFTYCALYDNGFSDPDEVKRKSTSPPTPGGAGGLFGGPCVTPSHCVAGRPGEICQGGSDAARDSSCDSEAGAADGFCDACPLRGGVTTEDEMFALFGAFVVP